METQWASHAFQTGRTVLGLRLRPYACGHEINLCQIESPFVLDGTPEWHDLLLASLICSENFREGRRWMTSPRKLKWFATLWRLLLGRRINFTLELHELRCHIKEGSWTPDTICLPEKGVTFRTLKAPRAYRLIPFLCANLGLSEAEALDFPLARAHAYYAALADKAGEIQLADDVDPLRKHLEELEARAAKGENVWEF